MPAFPKPTHGPEGSGLKPLVTIAEALRPITRHPNPGRLANDVYHRPKFLSDPRPSYDFHSQLRGCITTSGPSSCHPSGLRNFTARETALLQSFPVGYKFAGSRSEVKKQAGNAYPPVAAAALYREISRTLEAFDNGLIDAEDDLSNMDLDTLLRANGKSIPNQHIFVSGSRSNMAVDLPIRYSPTRPRGEFNVGFNMEHARIPGVGGAGSPSSSAPASTFSYHRNRNQTSARSVPRDTDEVVDMLDDDNKVIDLLDDDDDDDLEYMGTQEMRNYFRAGYHAGRSAVS